MSQEDSPIRPLGQLQILSLIQHVRVKFPHHSLQAIIEGLKAHLQVKKEHIQQKEQKKEYNSEDDSNGPERKQGAQKFYQQLNAKTPAKKNNQRRIQEIQRKQEIRLIAQTYIQGGLNYNNVKDICPSIGGKFYRNTVQAVNNNVIKEMERYLRYQCNIQIQRLNRDQKRSIRTQLTRIRQWLGKRDVAQLQTFYKFIQKRYQLIKVDISIQEALKLYKTILQIVKSPFVDVLQDQIKTQELQSILQDAGSSQKDDPQKTIILLFLHHRNLTKISDLLCQKYGYELKYSKHSIKHQMRRILKNSIRKLVACIQAYEDKSAKLFFSQSDKCIDLLASNQSALDLKVSLLSFYLQKTITIIQLRQMLKNTNKFFIRQFKDHGIYNFQDMKVRIKIPKLEVQKSKKQELSQKIKKNETLSQIPKKQQNIQELQVEIKEQALNQEVRHQEIGQNNMKIDVFQQGNALFFCDNLQEKETNLPDHIYQQPENSI